MGIYWSVSNVWAKKPLIMRLKLSILALICSVWKLEIKNVFQTKQTSKLHTVLSMKFNDTLIIEEETSDSETGLGFVDKFVSLFALRKKLDSVRSDILAKKWTSAYPHVWEINYTIELSTFKILYSKSYFLR